MKKTLALLGMLALAGCAADQAPPSHADRSPQPKIQLDVQTINLADRSGLQPANSPYNSNHFSPTIADAIKQWAGDRLQAAGQSGQAIIVIKDASLMAQSLPVTQGIDGWFTREQGVKYIGRAEISVEANGRPGFAMADAVATRSVTLPENPTAVEKQDAYYTLLNGLMKDLGQNMESGISAHMSGFILRPQTYGGMSGGYSSVDTLSDISPVIVQGGSPMQQDMQEQGISQYPLQPPAAYTVQPPLLPSPPQVAVSPPTMTISQSSMAPSMQNMQPAYTPSTYAQPPAMQNMASASPLTISSSQYQNSPGQNGISQIPLPPPQPVYGSQTISTVPDLASSPNVFAPQMADINAPPPIQTPARAQQQPQQAQQQAFAAPMPIYNNVSANTASGNASGSAALPFGAPQPQQAMGPATIPLSGPMNGLYRVQ